jgi:hypothetical protein
MPRKTQGEKIDELSHTLATLTERADNLRLEVERTVAGLSAIREVVSQQSARLAVLEEKSRGRDQSFQHSWILFVALLRAAASAIWTWLLTKP